MTAPPLDLVVCPCQWCTDEDWPCSDMRHAETTARALLNEPEDT